MNIFKMKENSIILFNIINFFRKEYIFFVYCIKHKMVCSQVVPCVFSLTWDPRFKSWLVGFGLTNVGCRVVGFVKKKHVEGGLSFNYLIHQELLRSFSLAVWPSVQAICDWSNDCAVHYSEPNKKCYRLAIESVC